MRSALPLIAARAVGVPEVPFVRFRSLWIQLTGTWCNLTCAHCLNASGPDDPWLAPLAPRVVRRALLDAERLGVQEIYFTGGEPFLHRELLSLLEASLAVAPTTVLTNGMLITDAVADRLQALAVSTRYSLEIRVSLDDVDPARNDGIRGAGAWASAVEALRRLDARGLLPIVAATEILGADAVADGGLYRRFRDFLRSIGIEKPRVKVIPVFAIGRRADPGGPLLTEEALEGFDRALLQCSETRVLAAGGVYACPILAGLPGARLSGETLEESFQPASLFHPACTTCHQTGMTCRNY